MCVQIHSLWQEFCQFACSLAFLKKKFSPRPQDGASNRMSESLLDFIRVSALMDGRDDTRACTLCLRSEPLPLGPMVTLTECCHPYFSLLTFPEACRLCCYVGPQRERLERCICHITRGAMCGKDVSCLVLSSFQVFSFLPPPSQGESVIQNLQS